MIVRSCAVSSTKGTMHYEEKRICEAESKHREHNVRVSGPSPIFNIFIQFYVPFNIILVHMRRIFNIDFSTIRKTCTCSAYPLEPHFYIAKLGYAGVYLCFLLLLQNIDCGYSLEPPRRCGSNVCPQSVF